MFESDKVGFFLFGCLATSILCFFCYLIEQKDYVVCKETATLNSGKVICYIERK